jgi:hypothetical protein
MGSLSVRQGQLPRETHISRLDLNGLVTKTAGWLPKPMVTHPGAILHPKGSAVKWLGEIGEIDN